MFEFVFSGLRSGVRDRSLQAVFVLGVLTIVAAYLSSSFSPRQPETVALDIGLSGVRISLVLLNLLWVQELVTREIDRRTIFFSLAYPVSRGTFLLGRFGAIVALSAIAAAVLGMMLTLAVSMAGGGYEQEIQPSLGAAFWLTIAGYMVDAALVAMFSLFVATFSTTPILPLALGAAFAVGGQALGATVDYLASGDADPQTKSRIGPVLDLVRWLLPDLSRLDWRDWPMYHSLPPDGTILWSMVMAFSYISILMMLSVAVFEHREFS